MYSSEDESTFPAPALTVEYYEEARLCWYVGAYVSTIIMVQLAFEELMRSTYRVTYGIGGKLASGKKVDKAGFLDLIDEARNDESISKEEAESLNNLRRLRNPYVHVRDVKVEVYKKTDSEKHDFVTQYLKIAIPELTEVSAEEEAKDSIHLLVTLFPKIARRFYS